MKPVKKGWNVELFKDHVIGVDICCCYNPRQKYFIFSLRIPWVGIMVIYDPDPTGGFDD